ncbi:filamin-A-like isoform X2 [Mercenaria mercenaria]|uniref:filamin-A-like isoform X2 n=1 Tax=Mercenaria mercenaria TaxID=6596 RepID=UPI00234F7B0E|nr:filamin-A-like isoform X2 [Mercenaria mercenaria]
MSFRKRADDHAWRFSSDSGYLDSAGYKMPTPEGLKPEIKDNSDGSINVSYQPKIQGRHEVQMCYEGAAVDGSPFQCLVDSIGDGFVSVYGTGLVGGMSGETESFTVVSKSGTQNDVQVTIDGPARTEVTRNVSGAHATFSYLPMTSGAYNINISYKGKPIKGSPFQAKVSGEGRKRSQMSIANCSDYALNVVEPEIVDLFGALKKPSGAIEPCILKKMGEGGHLGICSFAPKEMGKYMASISRADEKPIKGSPFTINVGDKEIAHAAKVHLTGQTTSAQANTENTFTIDTTGAGYGGVSVVVEGPHRSELEYEELEPRKYKVMYSPHEPGIYILNVRFADEHVTGSPFLLNVAGEPSGRKRETVSREMEQAEAVQPNTRCEFLLKIPGTNPFDMEASITDPDGQTELCEVMDEDDFHYRINFTPKYNGIHILSIKHKAMHISGSPFQYTIGQLKVGGAYKVQVGGPGLEKGEAGQENHFNIYTREAGAGSLSVGIEGPGTAKIKIEERPHGFLGVSYNVDKPGMYGIHVKFNDEHIPDSPFRVNVSPDGGSARQVTVHALKDRGLSIDKPATFTVSFNGASGQLHSYCRSPSGGHEDCFVQEMDTGLYAIRFVPKENGVHYIDVKLNDTHVPDSPFAVMVGSVAADPAMVHAHGDGLENGKCNAKAKFTVRTAGSGSGFLACFIDGPSKVALSCKEVDEGYEFSYTPFAAGKYLITLKYGNIGIAGSPYQAVVTGTGRKASPILEQSSMVVETVEKKPGSKVSKRFRGDASKVVARGPGIKKAFLNRVQNLTLDVKEAGNAMLSVGMMTPSGNPEAELSVKKASNTSYTISYNCKEPGEHTLQIKWGDEDIPGSPFSLHA